jgi:hypothetical protein
MKPIGSVLARRMAEVGDAVSVGHGTWGLKEWYPNRSFKEDDEKKMRSGKAMRCPNSPPGLAASKYAKKEVANWGGLTFF